MKSEKITVSLPTETIQIANEKFTVFGFVNRSEFINAAIREYVSRDILRQFSGELAQLYSKIERSEIKQMEQHISKLFYKIAVEQAQLYLLLASAIELPAVTDSSLKGKAVRMVNEVKGFVPVSKAARQAEAIPERNEDEMDDWFLEGDAN